ncbi:O-acetyl-ADP-ribose deacetylase [Arthrobacter sp. zg-Y1219]|uniref:O-acetyl-ADP-ribose deacetylase n=1 Tax=Arthrobacter sp. zg-Y1219 TaxID=3049067 RepID=UPI0024C3C4B5|nr:O-acetyl-ADP-ribose deacetylase [Arthrobacter sp. zg-Y1219]MDK1360057.1 O-acetyl-ADP-ribose deacetylase [Arthrobacter sp. zg-Y1219]
MQIHITAGDITASTADAIVNAANSSLLGGGGVDGAIHRAAGPALLAACRELRSGTWAQGLPTGEAAATPGFDLPARWVIHTVGPNARAGETDPALLASCFRRALDIAEELGAETVAFPAISAGVYGWNPATVARVGLSTVRDYPARTVRSVDFVLFGAATEQIFRSVWQELSAASGTVTSGTGPEDAGS